MYSLNLNQWICEISNRTDLTLLYDLTNLILVHKFNEYSSWKIKIKMSVQISVF